MTWLDALPESWQASNAAEYLFSRKSLPRHIALSPAVIMSEYTTVTSKFNNKRTDTLALYSWPYLTSSDAQLSIDEDRAAQLGVDIPAAKAANVAHGAAGEKFYAVLRDRRLGVFNSWHEAQRSTGGFPHSRHKPFDTHAAATAWLERKILVATELEASATAERLRDKRLASPVASNRDFDNASTSRVGVLANIGAASVQIGRGLKSWVSHRINTHDAPPQERRHTGSNHDCGSLVSSKPEHAAVPPVLDRADGPALHTPQSAPSQCQVFAVRLFLMRLRRRLFATWRQRWRLLAACRRQT